MENSWLTCIKFYIRCKFIPCVRFLEKKISMKELAKQIAEQIEIMQEWSCDIEARINGHWKFSFSITLKTILMYIKVEQKLYIVFTFHCIYLKLVFCKVCIRHITLLHRQAVSTKPNDIDWHQPQWKKKWFKDGSSWIYNFFLS